MNLMVSKNISQVLNGILAVDAKDVSQAEQFYQKFTEGETHTHTKKKKKSSRL